MSSQTALIQLHLIDYAPQGGALSTDLLPEILILLDPARVAVKLLANAETLDVLEANLSLEARAWRIVFYDRAEPAVEKALLAGTPPHKALAAWEQEMQVLLGFQRKHRRNVLLVDRAAVFRAPDLFIPELCTHLDIPAPKDTAGFPPICTIASVESVIAAQTVAQSLRARRLNGELDASSLPLPEAAAALPCNVDAVFQSYTTGNLAADETPIQELKAENRLLLLQLGNAQKGLEEYFRHGNTQEQRTTELESQIKRLQKNAAQADGALLAAQGDLEQQQKLHKALAENAAAENDLLLMQLGSIQEELESYFLDAKKLRDACNKYEERLATLGGQSNAAARDAKGLNDQLQDVERKLQEARNTLRDTEGRMQQVAGHLHSTEDSLKEREQNLEQAQHNVTELENQLHLREDELHRFLQSTSWRVTGPLRRIKDRLSGSKDQEH